MAAFLHEAPLAILHSSENHAEYIAHRGLKECEAESVAYIVAGIIGLDTSAYSVGHIAGWTQAELEVLRATAAKVLRTAYRIADAITATPEKSA